MCVSLGENKYNSIWLFKEDSAKINKYSWIFRERNCKRALEWKRSAKADISRKHPEDRHRKVRRHESSPFTAHRDRAQPLVLGKEQGAPPYAREIQFLERCFPGVSKLAQVSAPPQQYSVLLPVETSTWIYTESIFTRVLGLFISACLPPASQGFLCEVSCLS